MMKHLTDMLLCFVFVAGLCVHAVEPAKWNQFTDPENYGYKTFVGNNGFNDHLFTGPHDWTSGGLFVESASAEEIVIDPSNTVFKLLHDGNRAIIRSEKDLLFDPTNDGAASGKIQIGAAIEWLNDSVGDKISFYSNAYKIGVSPFSLDLTSDRYIKFHSDTNVDAMILDGNTGSLTIEGTYYGSGAGLTGITGQSLAAQTNDAGFVTTSDDSVSGSELDGVFPSFTGFLKRTGVGGYDVDTNTYVTTSDDSVSGSELDGVFSSGTGFLKRTGSSTYSIDSAAYLPTSGGTLSGNVVLPSNAIDAYQVLAEITYLDAVFVGAPGAYFQGIDTTRSIVSDIRWNGSDLEYKYTSEIYKDGVLVSSTESGWTTVP